MDQRKKLKVLIAVISAVLIIDQVSKIWIKTNMSIGEEIYIFGLDWAVIHFVENNGMAFGLSFGGEYGKLILSLFRITAVVLLAYYLRWLLRENAPAALLIGFGLILAGALGNIVDSAFYGMLFSESTFHDGPAAFLPEGGGYAGFLHGKVVDMFYFPIAEGFFPEWFPFWGGEPYLFFRPVFNVADMAITFGVTLTLVLHVFFARKIHPLIPESANKPVLETAPSPFSVPDFEWQQDSTAHLDEHSGAPAPKKDAGRNEADPN